VLDGVAAAAAHADHLDLVPWLNSSASIISMDIWELLFLYGYGFANE
jgi:hypothetical protein